MRRIFFLLLLILACTAVADERAEKRQLLSELLEVIDAKALMQTSFSNFLTTLATGFRESQSDPEDVPEEIRASIEESRRREEEEMHRFREQMYAQIDYARYFDEVYAPILEEEFTAAELRELIAFFKTKHGQKFARVLPRFGIGADPKGFRFIDEAATAAQKEIAKAEETKHPEKKTMAALRTIATALEARATDVDNYPNVTFDELEALLAPTYIREMPKVDSWGTPFFYIGDGQHYRVVSAGADKRFEWSSRHLELTNIEMRWSDDPDADIVFQDGNFLQAPKNSP
jgi:hypothetical protein